MNPHDPQAELDPTLLDQVLAEPTPAELQAKILELTDPQTLSLLDEALAPEAPDQLNDRILAATLPGYTPQATEQVEQPAVIGRITFSTWRYAAAAAAILLATGLGVWFISNPSADPAPRTTDVDNPNTTTPEVAFEEPIDIPDSDDDSGVLFAEVTSGVESDIQDVADSIEGSTIDRDSIWSEIDAYEQFVTDLEDDFSSLST